MTGIWYASREDVKAAQDFAETARIDARVDRAIETASRSIEGLLLRRFYPELATRYFDWPDRSGSRPWVLWLGKHELISVTTLAVAGETIASTDYFLRPDDGPPFTRAEIDLSSSAAFSSGDTHQRAIAITGLFGYRDDQETVGELTAGLDADITDTAAATWSRNIGVGDVLKINNERIIVTGRSMIDSTQNLGGPGLAASVADVTVPVTDGTTFLLDQVLLIDSERMLVVDIAGNNLTVKRAWDGTVLATHATSADIYTHSGIDIERAQLGTTLAAHLTGADITRLVIPAPIRSLCIAEALGILQQEFGGYGATSGSGETEQDAAGAGLPALRVDVRKQYGRRNRTSAI